MTKVCQALCAPLPRPELGSSPCVVRHSLTHTGEPTSRPHFGTESDSGPQAAGALRLLSCARAVPGSGPGEVRAAPALCRPPVAAQRSLTPGSWLVGSLPRRIAMSPRPPARTLGQNSHRGLQDRHHQPRLTHGKAPSGRQGGLPAEAGPRGKHVPPAGNTF